MVSIIIVNFNEEHFLLQLLHSLQKFEPALSKEVFILDNQSKVDIHSLIGDDFPEVSIHPQRKNEGFGKTSNKGIKMARGEFVLLLNPDTQFISASISECIEYFRKNSTQRVGAVACRLQGEGQVLQKSFFQLAASIKKAIQLNPLYIKFAGSGIKQQAERLDRIEHEKISNPDWLCGAFLLMNRDIILKEQFYFDEDFFLYSEDCELGYRIRKSGYQLIYLPDHAIIHFGGGSTPFLHRFNQLTISEWLCIMKVHGKLYFVLNQLLVLCNILMDELLFRKNICVKKIRMNDKREKIYRRKLWLMWLRFTFRILFLYNRRPSSSERMLKYQ